MASFPWGVRGAVAAASVGDVVEGAEDPCFFPDDPKDEKPGAGLRKALCRYYQAHPEKRPPPRRAKLQFDPASIEEARQPAASTTTTPWYDRPIAGSPVTPKRAAILAAIAYVVLR